MTDFCKIKNFERVYLSGKVPASLKLDSDHAAYFRSACEQLGLNAEDHVFPITPEKQTWQSMNCWISCELYETLPV